MNMKQAAQLALAAQSAYNLSGVAFSFAEVMRVVCSEASSTEDRNKHPVVVLFVTQLAYLSGVAAVAEFDAYHNAYKACERLAAAEEAA